MLDFLFQKAIDWMYDLGSKLEKWGTDWEDVVPRANYDTPVVTLNMNQTPMPPANPDALLPWTTTANCRHNCRALADLEGLSVAQKNMMSSVIHCESNYNVNCVHPNIVSGKTVSTDFSICQINDYYHIGAGKDFPSVEYVMTNPEACVRWMCKMVKAGKINLWVCASKNLYTMYSA